MTLTEVEKVTRDLQEAVSEFNKQLDKWTKETGCRAEFSWRYGTDRTQIKALEIQAIDLIVFRRPAPDFTTVRDAVKQAP